MSRKSCRTRRGHVSNRSGLKVRSSVRCGGLDVQHNRRVMVARATLKLLRKCDVLLQQTPSVLRKAKATLVKVEGKRP